MIVREGAEANGLYPLERGEMTVAKTYTSRYGKVSLPVTERVVRTTMLIPLYATMTEDEQTWVIDSLREELGQA